LAVRVRVRAAHHRSFVLEAVEKKKGRRKERKGRWSVRVVRRKGKVVRNRNEERRGNENVHLDVLDPRVRSGDVLVELDPM
jgi:hypothetical protein